MTTNQTIDGVPRELVRENIAYLRGMGGTYDQRSALAAKFELLLLDPAPPKELREQYEAWADANGYDITRNEHGDYAGIVEDSMWTGWQARGELRALLDKTEADIPASVPQGEPVAWLAQAVGKGGEVYRNKASTNEPTMRDIEIAWGQGVIDRFTIVVKPLYAEQPAPVAVVMPTQEDFERFIIRRDGSVNVSVLGKSRFYNDSTIDREYFVWLTCLDEVTRLNPSL